MRHAAASPIDEALFNERTRQITEQELVLFADDDQRELLQQQVEDIRGLYQQGKNTAKQSRLRQTLAALPETDANALLEQRELDTDEKENLKKFVAFNANAKERFTQQERQELSQQSLQQLSALSGQALSAEQREQAWQLLGNIDVSLESRKKIIDNLSNGSTRHNPESGWRLMQEISQGKDNGDLQLAWMQGDIDQPTYAMLAHYQNLPDDYSGSLQKQGMQQISRHYAEQLQEHPERAAAIYSHALQTQKMFKQACEYYQDNLVDMLANPEHYQPAG